MQRRQLLTAVGMVSLAGCGGMPKDALVKAEQKPTYDGTIDVVFSELPDAEQEIVRTAINEEFYHACPELPEAIRSFASRLESDEPYLGYRGNPYGLWVSIEDGVYAMTASPPENTPDCGIF